MRTLPRSLLPILLTAAIVLTAYLVGTGDRDDLLQECFGVNCPNQGAIDVVLKVERCDNEGECTVQPLDLDLYLNLVEFSGLPEERCGPGDCGGTLSALRGQGWQMGRWKIIAPPHRDLRPPAPVIIELEEHETEDVTLTYQGK